MKYLVVLGRDFFIRLGDAAEKGKEERDAAQADAAAAAPAKK